MQEINFYIKLQEAHLSDFKNFLIIIVTYLKPRLKFGIRNFIFLRFDAIQQGNHKMKYTYSCKIRNLHCTYKREDLCACKKSKLKNM